MSLIPLLLTFMATVTTSWNISLTTDEVSSVSETLTNAGSSLLSMFMQFRQPIVILAVIIWIITFISKKATWK